MKESEKIYIEKIIGYIDNKPIYCMFESNYTKEDFIKKIESFKQTRSNFISIDEDTSYTSISE